METTELRTIGKAKEYRRLGALNWIVVLVIVVALLILLFGVLFTPAAASDASMEPTLTAGDALLCDRAALLLSLPYRGQMVVYRDNGGTHIGRVIAFAGETVQMMDGTVYIDGRSLDESDYLLKEEEGPDMAACIVGEGCVMVLPDVRIGRTLSGILYEVPLSSLRGVVRLRLSPLSKIAFFAG